MEPELFIPELSIPELFAPFSPVVPSPVIPSPRTPSSPDIGKEGKLEEGEIREDHSYDPMFNEIELVIQNFLHFTLRSKYVDVKGMSNAIRGEIELYFACLKSGIKDVMYGFFVDNVDVTNIPISTRKNILRIIVVMVDIVNCYVSFIDSSSLTELYHEFLKCIYKDSEEKFAEWEKKRETRQL